MNQLSSKPKDDWTTEDKNSHEMYIVLKRFPDHSAKLTLEQVKWVNNHYSTRNSSGRRGLRN